MQSMLATRNSLYSISNVIKKIVLSYNNLIFFNSMNADILVKLHTILSYCNNLNAIIVK